jgi:16S rRNA processing protein RimM
VIAFKGVNSRTAAEALKGTRLLVPRAALPKTGDEEFYHADLIGLAAYDGEGRLVGKVSGIDNFGAGDVIELTGEDGNSLYLAFTRHTVPRIDIEGGRITVAVPHEDDADGAPQ